MRRHTVPIALLLVGMLLGCNETIVQPAFEDVAVTQEPFASKAHAPAPRTFVAPLSGGEEVPSNDSKARGNAIFQLSKDGTTLSYKLIVANLENVLQAHIHLAPAGANGPVVAWLYPGAPPAQLIPGRSSGILAEGTITAGDLVGPLAGQPLSALIDHLRDGNAYVNVHTLQYPPGEIRGQIR